MKISVIGLGYVGIVSSFCFAEMGHDVVGDDINRDKVRALNSGELPVSEPGLDEIARDVLDADSFRAVSDIDRALEHAETVLVSVGTPGGPEGRINLDAVEAVGRKIGANLEAGHSVENIILRSTVLPGTMEKFIQWVRRRAGEEADEANFYYHPEFLREGDAVEDFYDPPFIVFGTGDDPEDETDKVTDLADRLYPEVDAPVEVMEYGESELIKYACNAFHALKVGFANEIGRFASELDVDGRLIMEAFCKDQKLNISDAYLEPGFAFGGSCLPKDLTAITSEAERRDLELPILNNILSSNDVQLAKARQQLDQVPANPIGVLGMTFKENTDDVRESPMLKLIGRLRDRYTFRVYDERLDPDRIHGSNLLYLEQALEDPSEYFVDSIEQLLEESRCVVIGTREEIHREHLRPYLDSELTVFDWVGLYDESPSDTWEYFTLFN